MKFEQLFIFLFLSFTGLSQQITGVVIDMKTNKPVNGASVYFNNTTIGTITNPDGEFAIKYEKKLNTQLIISFIGYETFIVGDLFFKKDLMIPLIESEYILNEVELSSNDNWSRALKLREFKKQFLGKYFLEKSCQILNEEAIQLSYDTRKKLLTAKSTSSIIIENNFLGYEVSVDLYDFRAEYSHVSRNKKRINVKYVTYNGANLYKLIDEEPTDNVLKQREEIYFGSTLHFMRSLAAKKLKQEDYRVFLTSGQHIENIYRHFKVSSDTIQHVVNIKLKNRMSILFSGERQSSIECTNGAFTIDSFGNHTPLDEVIFTGDFANQRMADQLPLDYFVTTLINPQ